MRFRLRSRAFSRDRSRTRSRHACQASRRRPNHASGPANHDASFARVKVETRYTATITVVPVATIAPATFREFTSQLASTYPSVPPSRTVPAKIRHGAKLSAAHRLNVSSSDPITLTVPASTASDRIHFHASRKVKNGNSNAAAPNI